MPKKIWKKVLLALALVIVAGATFMVVQIGPSNIIGMIRYDQRRDGDLQVGQRAPDAMLVSLDGKTRVPLLQPNSGKPLILVFGSFT